MLNPLLLKFPIPAIPKVSNPSRIRQALSQWICWVVVAVIVAGSVVAFTLWIDPALKGENHLRIGADSAFYLWAAGLRHDNPYGADFDSTLGVIGLGSNLLGPLVIAHVLKSNFLILCFNYVLLCLSVWYFARSRLVNASLLTLLLLLNPAILVSVLTLNKEILAIFATALLAYYLVKPSTLLLFAVCLVSLLARWEHLLIVLLFLFLKRYPQRWLMLGLLVAGISLLYPRVGPYLLAGFPHEEWSGNTILMLTALQLKGLYFLSVVPKIGLNLYGGIAAVFRQDPTDIYNRLIVPLACVADGLVTLWFLLRRRLTLRDDMIYFAVLYAVVMAISPFAQLRYFLPVYAVMCVALTASRERLPGSPLA